MKKNRDNKDLKIVIGKRIITRDILFKNKEKFHKAQSKMPFEEKIALLVKLQRIAASIKKDRNITIWKI